MSSNCSGVAQARVPTAAISEEEERDSMTDILHAEPKSPSLKIPGAGGSWWEVLWFEEKAGVERSMFCGFISKCPISSQRGLRDGDSVPWRSTQRASDKQAKVCQMMSSGRGEVGLEYVLL